MSEFNDVLLVGSLPPPLHGASKVTERLCRELVARGLSVEVIDTSVKRDRLYHVRRLTRLLRAGLLVLTRGHPRLVLYQAGAGGLGLWYQAGLVAAARLVGMPQVFHHHSYAYLTRRSRAMGCLSRWGGARLHHIALSRGMADQLRAAYGCVRVSVVSNAAVLGAGERSTAGREGTLRLGHLSNLSAEKGLDVVLETASELRRKGTPVVLKLAGPAATDAAMQTLQAHLEKHPSDEWLGPLDPSQVPAYMRSLDCFLFPSSYVNEALPLVVLEALREGTPVVASPIGCLPELLTNHGEGDWLAEPQPRPMAHVVSMIERDERARERAFSLYAEEYSANPMEVLVRSVLTR